MSVNDRNDWDDGLDFESLADEQIEAATEPEPQDEQSCEEPHDDEYVDEDVAGEEPVAEDEAEPERPRLRRKSGPRVSGTGLGLIFAFSIIVAAVGIGGALVLALGVDPVSLWQPESFRQLDQILDLDQNPLNLVYIVTLATLLLTLLGGWGVSRAVRKVGVRATGDAELIERIAALRIDDESGWQDQHLRDHPQLSTFVTENLGTWRMQEQLQKRATGLEGELQRLTKAATADERDLIDSHYEHPAVGSMADEITRIYDEREAARREAEATRSKERDESQAVLTAVTEVAGWNLSFTDQVGVQGAAAAGLTSRLRDLLAEQGGDDDDDRGQAIEAVNFLRQEIQALARHENTAAAPDLAGLADRGNKLAFQIAMEVARLGNRGERLLPMTQALEELTTDVREAAQKLAEPTETTELEAFRDRCQSRLINLQDHLESADTGVAKAWVEGIEEALPAAKQLAGQLGSVAENGNDQTRRINKLGAACAALLGLDYKADQVDSPDPATSQEEDSGFTRFDPFSKNRDAQEEEAPLAADPFAAPDPEPVAPSADFMEGEVSAPVDQEYDPWGDESSQDAVPAPDEQPAATDEPLTVDSDAVDLSAYGAQKIEDGAVDLSAYGAQKIEDGAVDLSAYGAQKIEDGAVRIDENPAPAAPAAPEETVHDLVEYGAERID